MAIGLQEVDNLKPSKYLEKLLQENVTGEKTIYEVEKELKEYYVEKEKNNEVNHNELECDLVSTRIVELLQEDNFELSVDYLKYVHKYLFQDVYEFAGEFRKVDFSKHERILNNDSVAYGDHKLLEQSLDYDMVKDLSTQELEEMRKEIEDKLEHLSLKWLNASINTREKLDKDKEYNFNIKSLKYYIESINKYINNKEIYDSEISTLSFNNFKKVELKRYPAVSRTESISRIPVSSSEMEKLNQSIRSKCKQNASEQTRGRDAAKDFITGSTNLSITNVDDETTKDCRSCQNMSCRVESCEKPIDNCIGYIHHDEKQHQPKNMVLTKKRK